MANYVADGYVESGYYQTGISIDWPNRVIHIPKSYLTFVGGSVYQLDTESFRIDLKLAEQSEQGQVHPPTHNHNTSVLLGGIEYARIIEIINGYTITFEDGSYVVNLVGSNNNVLDVSNLNSVQVRSNNSAGLINILELQQIVFDSAVHVDQSTSNSGQIYPIGTPLRPVNNFADAIIIAQSRGFKTLKIYGNAVLDTGDNVSGYRLVGENAARTLLTINDAATISNSEIENCSVTGILDGNALIRECYVYDLSFFSGFMFQCQIYGTITLGNSTQANILNCFSADANLNPPILDCGGSGQSFVISAYSGNIKLVNKTGPDYGAITLIGGEVQLDLTTVTNGTIRVQGNGKVVDALDNEDHLPHGNYGSFYLDNETTYGRQLQEVWTQMGLDPDDPTNYQVNAIFNQAQVTPIHGDMRRVRGTTITGSGTEENPWGP